MWNTMFMRFQCTRVQTEVMVAPHLSVGAAEDGGEGLGRPAVEDEVVDAEAHLRPRAPIVKRAASAARAQIRQGSHQSPPKIYV
jgi:hypothetical protein